MDNEQQNQPEKQGAKDKLDFYSDYTLNLVSYIYRPVPETIEEISKKVCLAKGEISAVGKDAYNAHDKYKYASVDDVYNACRVVMAKHGLDLRIEELEYNRFQTQSKAGGTVTWLEFKFLVGFVGEYPHFRTMIVQYRGPQTFEAAMSYVQKYFLRSRFQIATGEYELDGDKHEPAPAKGRTVMVPPAAAPQAEASQKKVPAKKPRATKKAAPDAKKIIWDYDDALEYHAIDTETKARISPDDFESLDPEVSNNVVRDLYIQASNTFLPKERTVDELKHAIDLAVKNADLFKKLIPQAGLDRLDLMIRNLEDELDSADGESSDNE